MIHFFDRFAIYWDPYMTTVKTEYWRGHRRVRVFRLGRVTAWVRGGLV